jgi:hypothetical protein
VGASAITIGLLLITGPAWGEVDVLMRAVGFALTGSDDAEPKAIGDRVKCVFAIKNNIYRLNNVHVDRITIQGWERKLPSVVDKWVTVALHGDDIVYEQTSEPAKDDGGEFSRQLRAVNPDAFKSHHYTYKETELRLATADQDRVTRAWTYIYSNGCVGKKSPF